MAFSIKAVEDSPANEPNPVGRYDAGYQTANLLQSAGKIVIYWLSWIYALLLVYEQTSLQLHGNVFFSLAWLPPILHQVLYIWMFGLILRGLGYIVMGVLDTAIDSSRGDAR